MTTSAYEAAKQFYAKYPSESLDRDILLYSREQWIVCTPRFIIMARDIGDTWHVHFAIGEGSLAYFLRCMPHYLPKISFMRPEKGKKLKIHSTDKLLKKLCST